MPHELAAAGYDIRPWYEHFAGRDDVEWLPAIGAQGWVLLTKDKDTRPRARQRKRDERELISGWTEGGHPYKAGINRPTLHGELVTD